MKKLVNGIEVELTAQEQAEVVAERESSKTEYEKNKYKKNRKTNYPDIGEQLDVIWKFLGKCDNLDENTKMMYNIIMDVKNKFPKPE